jgi:hypothetical protein
MSLHTLLHVCTNSKAKKFPRLVRSVPVIPRRSPTAAQDKEACHAL